MAPTLVLLRGLSTVASDDFRIGPLAFGPVYAPWLRALQRHPVSVVPVMGISTHAPQEQAVELAPRLAQIASSQLVLLGHSAGGLTARALAHQPSLHGRIRDIITIGTPHQGTNLAELALSYPQRRPLLARAFRTVGYDLKIRSQIFSVFTPNAISGFNQRYPDLPGVRYHHILAHTPPSHLCVPYQVLHRITHQDGGWQQPSDGYISCESQSWGTRLTETKLDHFAQIGYFLQAQASIRRELQQEFIGVADAVAELTMN